jgi:hypothetical protein
MHFGILVIDGRICRSTILFAWIALPRVHFHRLARRHGRIGGELCGTGQQRD